jgi:hypothetical protein
MRNRDVRRRVSQPGARHEAEVIACGAGSEAVLIAKEPAGEWRSPDLTTAATGPDDGLSRKPLSEK